jgi:hypothetical protein
MLKLVDLISISFITGFLGDSLLQYAVKYLNMGGQSGWGLKSYFKLHGSAESLFIAGGMMSLFYIIYYYLNIKFNYLYLIIYGIFLDLIFRKFMIFSSLKGYYNHLNYFWSAFWGAIPMILPFFIYKTLNNTIR